MAKFKFAKVKDLVEAFEKFDLMDCEVTGYAFPMALEFPAKELDRTDNRGHKIEEYTDVYLSYNPYTGEFGVKSYTWGAALYEK